MLTWDEVSVADGEKPRHFRRSQYSYGIPGGLQKAAKLPEMVFQVFSVIIFFGIGRIVVHALAIKVFAVPTDDALALVRTHEVDETGCETLLCRGAFGLAQGMIRVNQIGITTE